MREQHDLAPGLRLEATLERFAVRDKVGDLRPEDDIDRRHRARTIIRGI